ncbi:MAG: hypothetical protein JWP31_83 [Aeromicrobium sp.]|nr:hypothetical protein [Aeromicrobium sp.]
MAVDFKSLGKFEQGALIAGALSFIFSFFDHYVTAEAGGVGGGIAAWESYATLGMLLIIVATAIIAARAFARDSLPADLPWNLIALVAAGLGTILLILRAVTFDYGSPGWSGYVLFITTIALTVFTALMFRDSGDKMPDFNKRNNTPPAA